MKFRHNYYPKCTITITFVSLSPSVNSNFEIQQKHRNLEIYHPRWFPPEIKTNREAWRQTAQRHKFFFFYERSLSQWTAITLKAFQNCKSSRG